MCWACVQIAGSETSSFLFNMGHDHNTLLEHLQNYQTAATTADGGGGGGSGVTMTVMVTGPDGGQYVLMGDSGAALAADVEGQVGSGSRVFRWQRAWRAR